MRTARARREKVQRRAASSLRKTFVRFRQWGIEMPGGAEALVHRRGLVEELAISGAIEPLVVFDLDLANMFGSIEWPRIREAIDKHFPRRLPLGSLGARHH